MDKRYSTWRLRIFTFKVNNEARKIMDIYPLFIKISDCLNITSAMRLTYCVCLWRFKI